MHPVLQVNSLRSVQYQAGDGREHAFGNLPDKRVLKVFFRMLLAGGKDGQEHQANGHDNHQPVSYYHKMLNPDISLLASAVFFIVDREKTLLIVTFILQQP
jgi:hypothetical protein